MDAALKELRISWETFARSVGMRRIALAMISQAGSSRSENAWYRTSEAVWPGFSIETATLGDSFLGSGLTCIAFLQNPMGFKFFQGQRTLCNLLPWQRDATLGKAALKGSVGLGGARLRKADSFPAW